MTLDGWSNVNNDPIVCFAITVAQGKNAKTYLSQTFDTSGNSHTAEYLCQFSTGAITATKELFGCSVGKCGKSEKISER